MPFNGSGTFVRVHNWTSDAANGIDINATEMDAEDNGFAAGLSICVTRDGQGRMAADFLPSVGSTYNLGNSTLPWASLNGVPIENFTAPTQQSLGQILFPTTNAETAAGLTPTSFVYPELDVRRYGADPSGVADSTSAISSALLVALQLGGGVIYFFPGTYKTSGSITATLFPSSGATSATQGLTFSGRDAMIQYSGNAYAFDFTAANTSPTFAQPTVVWDGIGITGTSSGLGGIRTSGVCAQRFYDVFVYDFTNGAGFTLNNNIYSGNQLYSENNHFYGCGSYSNNYGMVFSVNGGTNSFARTQVDGFFFSSATITPTAWFYIGAGCSVYDSCFKHISGNNAAVQVFLLGTYTVGGGVAANDCDMTDTYIDGLDFENGSITNQKGIIKIANYPYIANVARRPIVTNAGATARSGIPLWISGSNATVSPESVQTQPFQSWTGMAAFETIAGLNAQKTVATYDSTQTASGTCTLTGCTATVTGRVNFYRVGTMAYALIYDPLTGTSNSTAMTLTGIPSEFQPVNGATSQLCSVTNNGVANLCVYSVTGSTITFSLVTAVNAISATGFTASGTKGLGSGALFSWPLT